VSGLYIGQSLTDQWSLNVQYYNVLSAVCVFNERPVAKSFTGSVRVISCRRLRQEGPH